MESMTQHLLNDYQRGFPLAPRPFSQIARSLNTRTNLVLEELKSLQSNGVVSRIGPVFKPNTVGASTLATMSVPANQLERVAAIINKFPQVNHNYEREHHYNLWFVVTAADRSSLQSALQQIRRATGREVLSLPMVKDYHIDLGFNMSLESKTLPVSVKHSATVASRPAATPAAATEPAEDLIAAIQDGLPLVARPYLKVGEQLGWSEATVIGRLRDMLAAGTIKRMGVVVRHHELGYRANAMVVWDVPQHRIDELGQLMGDLDDITLCYQRPRVLPYWPYNLFCMIHGRDRTTVTERIRRMVSELSLEDMPHDTLFSGRRFKQRGARYRVNHSKGAGYGRA